jgi:hypothetical protein
VAKLLPPKNRQEGSENVFNEWEGKSGRKLAEKHVNRRPVNRTLNIPGLSQKNQKTAPSEHYRRAK